MNFYKNFEQALISLGLLLLIYKGYWDIREINFSRSNPKPNFPSGRASFFGPTSTIRSHIASVEVRASIPSLQPNSSLQPTTSMPTLQTSTLSRTSEMAKLQNWDTSQMELKAENVSIIVFFKVPENSSFGGKTTLSPLCKNFLNLIHQVGGGRSLQWPPTYPTIIIEICANLNIFLLKFNCFAKS